jgi:hypothetical protein
LPEPGSPDREDLPRSDADVRRPSDAAGRAGSPKPTALSVSRHGEDAIVGVLALAHDGSIETDMRSVVLAAGDLAAVAIDRLCAD